jgi:hypothetical protein
MYDALRASGRTNLPDPSEVYDASVIEDAASGDGS